MAKKRSVLGMDIPSVMKLNKPVSRLNVNITTPNL
jgi:hypothetical protein